MAVRGAGKPVNCSNWRAAWWTRRSRPVTRTWPGCPHRPGRGRAPSGPAGSARGGRRPRTRPEPRNSARPRRRSGRWPGWWRRRPRRPRRRRATTAPRRGVRRGAGRSRPRLPRRGRDHVRGAGSWPHRDRPSPDRSTQRWLPRPGRSPHRSRPTTARGWPHRRPGTSVLSANHRPSACTSVLATPARMTIGETSSARSAASRFSGAVTDNPRHDASEPVDERREPTRQHAVRVVLPLETARVVRRPVQHRRQRVRDRDRPPLRRS